MIHSRNSDFKGNNILLKIKNDITKIQDACHKQNKQQLSELDFYRGKKSEYKNSEINGVMNQYRSAQQKILALIDDSESLDDQYS